MGSGRIPSASGRSYPTPDRERFLRHLRPWWDVHRHRAAPSVLARIDDARARGQFHIVAGRVKALRDIPDGVAATITLRGGKDTIGLQGSRAIDCTGLNNDCTRIDQPLLRRLLAAGLIRPDALRLGLDVDRDGALIDREGKTARDLWAIGPITKGAFWEIVAVPDLRLACEAMATRLTERIAIETARPIPA